MNATGGAKRVATQIDLIERYELPDVVIGKDVLELVSSAMYVDPMTVYREYVQNAADAIDAARAAGLLAPDQPGRVEITVEPGNRAVRIRDNGSGVPFQEFGRKLAALGSSAKRGTRARGFRGVGRLAGLGYAQEVIFRSRVPGEDKVSELRWDCRRLRTALRDAGEVSGVSELIRSLTTLQRVGVEDAPERYFEVEIKGIVRLRNDRLISPAVIAEYLSQVAPVPFSPDFRFGAELTEKLLRQVDLCELDIRINGSETPIFRPHRNCFRREEKESINFDRLTVSEIPGIDGNVSAIAWVLHHEYEGAVPAETLVKGLRLRAGNVQVGDHALLEDLFPEARFNAWSVGEVHVIDRRIIPNGRRDNFEQNAHLHNLLNHLAPTARDIARHCRTSSERRKWQREFESNRQVVEEKLDIVAQGSLSRSDRQAVLTSVEPALRQLDKIAEKDLFAEGDVSSKASGVSALRARVAALGDGGPENHTPLAHLGPEKREMYEHLFSLIYECSTNRVAAKALVDRILDKLQSTLDKLQSTAAIP